MDRKGGILFLHLVHVEEARVALCVLTTGFPFEEVLEYGRHFWEPSSIMSAQHFVARG